MGLTLDPRPASPDEVAQVEAAQRLVRWSLALAFAAVPLQQLIILPVVGPLTDLLVPIAVLGAVIGLLRGAPMRRPPVTLGFLLAFVGWTGATYFWSIAPGQTAARFLTYLQLLALATVVLLLVRTRADRSFVIQGYVLGSSLVVLRTLANFVQGNQANTSTEYLRFAAGEANPNRTAAALLIAMACAWYLLVRSRRLRAFNLGVILATPLALLLTASRSAFVAGAVFGALVLIWSMRTGRSGRAGVLFVVGAAVLVALALVPDSALDRITAVGGGAEVAQGSVDLRSNAIDRGLEAFWVAPVHGSGAGTFAERTAESGSKGVVAHNSYLSVATELGLVGFVLFAGAALSAVWQLRRADEVDRWFGILLLVVWALIAAFASFEDDKLTWLALMLLATTPPASVLVATTPGVAGGTAPGRDGP